MLLANPWHEAFLSGRPGPVDRVVVVPPSEGVRIEPELAAPEEMERFFEAMWRERFDLAVQLHGDGRYSNPFVLNLGARMTAGLRTPDAAPLDRWVPYVYYQPEVPRFLEVVSLVGTPAVRVEPRLEATEGDAGRGDGGRPGEGATRPVRARGGARPGQSAPRRTRVSTPRTAPSRYTGGPVSSSARGGDTCRSVESRTRRTCG